jgi:hypothetical protein
MARQLAKANNMAFREDYVKRFNSKVSPHEFKEGMLVYLHRPDMVKVNPKLQSPWFGPFVILSMIGDHHCLIQELSNKKTKFVNVNRLRAYNNSIAEWNNFKLTLNEKNNKKKNADMQEPDEKIKCTANADATAPRYAEFERDNDVVILNPEVEPIPKTIKVEPEEGLESVTPELSEQQDEISDLPNTSTSSKSKSPSLAKILHKLVLPPKPPKKKTLVSTDRVTRKQAQDSGTPVPDVQKSKQDLEKLKKKSKKK